MKKKILIHVERKSRGWKSEQKGKKSLTAAEMFVVQDCVCLREMRTDQRAGCCSVGVVSMMLFPGETFYD